MGLAHRMAEAFRAKAHAALERAEDPRELLDYSYTLQRDLLAKVRRGVVDVAAARRRVEDRKKALRASAERLQEQAERVLATGHEDLAREVLTRRTNILARVDELAEQQADLKAEEERLTAAAERLQAKVDAFSRRKEALKARYTLAEAETYVGETVTGISGEMTDVDVAARQGEERAARTRARAAALDDLLEAETLGDAMSTAPGEALPAGLQARLDEALTRAEVEEELRAMKARPGGREPAPSEPPGGPERAAGDQEHS